MLENKVIKGIHASRYIASWLNVGGYNNDNVSLADWLSELDIDGEKLSEKEIAYIEEMMWMGKLELEKDARAYLAKNKE